MLEIYTAEGVATGEACPREEVHRLGLWHLTVHLWLRCRDELLLQKRSAGKETHPDLWDISSAGHVDFGEAPREAALRELQEELGLAGSVPPLAPLGVLRRESVVSVPKDGRSEKGENVVSVPWDGRLENGESAVSASVGRSKNGKNTFVPSAGGVAHREPRREPFTDREWTCVYLQTWEEKPACRPDSSEVAAVRWLPWRDFKRDLMQNAGRYVPHEEEYGLLFRFLEGST